MTFVCCLQSRTAKDVIRRLKFRFASDAQADVEEDPTAYDWAAAGEHCLHLFGCAVGEYCQQLMHTALTVLLLSGDSCCFVVWPAHSRPLSITAYYDHVHLLVYVPAEACCDAFNARLQDMQMCSASCTLVGTW